MRRIMRRAVALLWLISGQLALGQNLRRFWTGLRNAYAIVQTFDFHGTTQGCGIQHRVSFPIEMAKPIDLLTLPQAI
jgi:hypothetical protein